MIQLGSLEIYKEKERMISELSQKSLYIQDLDGLKQRLKIQIKKMLKNYQDFKYKINEESGIRNITKIVQDHLDSGSNKFEIWFHPSMSY